MTNDELDGRLAESLVRYNVLTAAQVDRARAFQEARRSTLAGALCELHVVTEDVVRWLLEELTGIRAVDPSLLTVYPDFIERMNVLIPPAVVRALLVFPAQAELKAIHVCMLNPTEVSHRPRGHPRDRAHRRHREALRQVSGGAAPLRRR
jgi:hypothetical protein